MVDGCEEFEYMASLSVAELIGLYICIDRYIYENWNTRADPAELAAKANEKFNIYERNCRRLGDPYDCWRAEALRRYITRRVDQVIAALIEAKARGR